MHAQTAREQPQRPLGPIRRPQILAAAIELLREQGLWTVRVSDVARRAGTSPGTVIYYFGTKHQLFEQAIDAADAAFYASLRPELDQIETGTGRLARLIHRSSLSDWVLWVDLWAYARRHADMLEASIDFHRRWCSTIADVIRHGQLRGEFSARDARAIAIRFAALSNGLAIRMVLDDCAAPRAQYLAMSVEAAALELGCDADELRRELAAVPEVSQNEEPDRETEEAA
jgi:AcrR family transcriptional regulator